MTSIHCSRPTPGGSPARRLGLLLGVLGSLNCTRAQLGSSDGGGGAPDRGGQDLAGPPDLGPRVPWRTVSPTPEDSSFQALHGASPTDLYLITASAVVRRREERTTVEWRAKEPVCLRGVVAAGDTVIVSGGCSGVGLLLRRDGAGAWQTRELANLELAGLWAQGPEEVFVASPSAGVVRLRGADLQLERTVAPGELGTGPVALWGAGPGELYAVGGGRILRRRGEGQWEVERSAPGEVQLAVWGTGLGDVYVVGANERGGAIWHRTGAGMPFKSEAVNGAAPQVLRAVWGTGPGDVYAAADGGLVLRRDPLRGAWEVDRRASPEQPEVRALFGAGPGQLLAAGAGGLLERRGGRWEVLLGEAITGAALRALSLAGPAEGVAVGDAGVVLRLAGGRWAQEARGLTDAPLYGVAAGPDGLAYAVGRRGVVLRRDRAGVWAFERMAAPDGGADGGAPAEPDLRAVAIGLDGAVYAVGDEGRVLLREGGVWQPAPAVLTDEGPLRATLRAVAVLADGTVVAAGDEGTVLWRTRGAARFSVVAREPFSGLRYTGLLSLGAGASQQLLGCASGGAVLLRLQAGQLRREPAPLTQATALYGTGPNDLYLTGRDGAVWHWNGWGWGREPAPLGEPLLALGGSGETVVAAGEQGFLIQRP